MTVNNNTGLDDGLPGLRIIMNGLEGGYKNKFRNSIWIDRKSNWICSSPFHQLDGGECLGICFILPLLLILVLYTSTHMSLCLVHTEGCWPLEEENIAIDSDVSERKIFNLSWNFPCSPLSSFSSPLLGDGGAIKLLAQRQPVIGNMISLLAR